MNRGYTIVWNGWGSSAASVNNNLTISVPVSKKTDGSPITGPSYEYISYDNATSTTHTLAYENLAKRRLLLDEDVQKYIKTAEDSDVLK